MTKQEIILFLKSNTSIYALWPDVVREFANNIRGENWLVYRVSSDTFNDVSFTVPLSSMAIKDLCYRLKESYEEPTALYHWKEYDVQNDCIGYFINIGSDCVSLTGLMARIDFGGIKYKHCECLNHLSKETWFMSPIYGCDRHGPGLAIKVRLWEKVKP